MRTVCGASKSHSLHDLPLDAGTTRTRCGFDLVRQPSYAWRQKPQRFWAKRNCSAIAGAGPRLQRHSGSESDPQEQQYAQPSPGGGRRTRAGPVHAAVTSRRTTVRRKPCSRVQKGVSRKTPIPSARSMRSGWTRPLHLRSNAVRSPAAGIYRSDSGVAPCHACASWEESSIRRPGGGLKGMQPPNLKPDAPTDLASYVQARRASAQNLRRQAGTAPRPQHARRSRIAHALHQTARVRTSWLRRQRADHCQCPRL